MGKSLIIVESPAKVKTIKKFLGPGYLVQASVGHIRDLPKSNIGVDEANDFAPEYEIIQGKEKVVQSLRDAASKVDTVFLAPDAEAALGPVKQPDGVVTHDIRAPYHMVGEDITHLIKATGFSGTSQIKRLPRGQVLFHLTRS